MGAGGRISEIEYMMWSRDSRMVNVPSMGWPSAWRGHVWPMPGSSQYTTSAPPCAPPSAPAPQSVAWAHGPESFSSRLQPFLLDQKRWAALASCASPTTNDARTCAVRPVEAEAGRSRKWRTGQIADRMDVDGFRKVCILYT